MTPSEEQMDMTKQHLKMKEWVPFLESERLKQLIKHTKKTDRKYYHRRKSVLINQLNQAQAVESGEYERSPYSNDNYGLNKKLINNLAEKMRSQEHLTDDIDYTRKIIEFLDLQLEHIDAMIAKTYKLSPYFQKEDDRVKQVHGTLTVGIIDATIYELQEMVYSVDGLNEDFDQTTIGEHMLTLLMIHEFFREDDQNLTDTIISDKEYGETESESDYNDSDSEYGLNTEDEVTSKDESASFRVNNATDFEDESYRDQEPIIQNLENLNEEQRIITELKKDLNGHRELTKQLQKEIKMREEEMFKTKQHLEQKILQLQEENETLKFTNQQLKEKLNISQQSGNKKVFKNKMTTTTPLIQKHKIIQTNNKQENKEVQAGNGSEVQEDIATETEAMTNEKEHKNLEEIIDIKLENFKNSLQDMIRYSPENSILRDSTAGDIADPAILIKLKDTKQLNTVQEEISLLISQQEITSQTYRRLSKNKRTIIIKSLREELLNTLHKKLLENDNLQQNTEIIYKQQQMQKIIITGIPVHTDGVNILKIIKQHHQQNNQELTILKTLHKKSEKYYQMVVEADSQTAVDLLSVGSVNIGDRQCNISVYRPIIRCSNCQLYGHGSTSCLRQPICAFCARGHSTSVCEYAQQKGQINCTNCLERMDYKPHSADSPICPKFKEKIVQRNNFVKTLNNNLMNSYMNSYMNFNTISQFNSHINSSGMGFNPYHNNSALMYI